MSYVHMSVNETSKIYLTNERRYNYTTPKSFLEQIVLYQNLLRVKSGELIGNMQRLENGLTKLQSTAQQVGTSESKLQSCFLNLVQCVHTKILVIAAILKKVLKQYTYLRES